MPRFLIGRFYLLLGLSLLVATQASATKGGEPGYPRTVAYISNPGSKTEAEIDSLAWFDLLVGQFTPGVVEGLEQRNPHQRRLWNLMPQTFVNWDEDHTYWYPDTSYSLNRLCQYYAEQNDWYLYDIHGNRIIEWGGYYTANWTRYCPKGVYGTSKGLTYPEWFVQVAVPQVSKNNPAWEDWGEGSSSLDGLAFEVFCDCVNIVAPEDQFLLADPDRDGIAEGIASYCWDGGSQDSLSILFREANEGFRATFRAAWGNDFIQMVNRGSQEVGPHFIDQFNGIKFESWSAWHGSGEPNDPDSWWPYFYGRFHSNGDWRSHGYLFAEQVMQSTGVDRYEGWDWSLIQILAERWGPWPEEEKQKLMRFGVGTSMLGDGYFMFAKYNPSNTGSLWFPEFDWDFGTPAGDFGKEIVYESTADTLFYRLFEKGLVQVNPYKRIVKEMPAQDSQFSFWLTASDLAVASVGVDSVDITWTVPESATNNIDNVQVRYATEPLTLANWDEGESIKDILLTGGFSPGERATVTVDELLPQTTYYFAVRNVIGIHREPMTMSNQISATTLSEGPLDVDPPAAVSDLAGTAFENGLATFTWTAPGDDNMTGVADHYSFRYLAGGRIDSEAEWDNGLPVAPAYLPSPETAGTTQSFSLTGLTPGQAYGFAIRALDEAANMSDLSNPLLLTFPAPDLTPPAPINDLDTMMVSQNRINLIWSASGDDGLEGTGASYIFGYRVGQAISSELDWGQAIKITEGLPTPLAAGTIQDWQLTGLTPGVSYGLSLRVYDDEGLLSGLGNSPVVTTDEDVPPPDTVAPAAVDDLMVTSAYTDGFDLTWTAPGDDGDLGTSASYQLGYMAGSAIETAADWAAATIISDYLPDPKPGGGEESFRLAGLDEDRVYGLSIRALDEVGNISPLGPPLTAQTEAVIVPDTTPPARVSDLEIVQEYEDGFDLRWTAPGDDGTSGWADRYVFGYLPGRLIESEIDWLSADTLGSGTGDFPWPDSAGTSEDWRLLDLEPETFYGLALRAYDDEGNRSELALSEVGGWTLAEIPLGDTDSPAPITELFIGEPQPTSANVSWTCTGDDSLTGIATSFILAWIQGEGPFTEPIWESAAKITEGLPQPQSPGSVVTYSFGSLTPEVSYCLTVRAVDEEGNQSAIGASLSFVTPALTDLIAPARVTNLTAELIGETTALLSWTAPGDDGLAGVADSIKVAGLAGGEINSNEDWFGAVILTGSNQIPSGNDVSYHWIDLSYETEYGFSVRYGDEAGNWGDISNPVSVQTPDLPDWDPPAKITTLILSGIDGDRASISWLAVGDDDLAGRASLYQAGLLEEAEVTAGNFESAAILWTKFLHSTGGDPLPAPGLAGAAEFYTIDALMPGIRYGFALRAVDSTGNAGVISDNLVIDVPPAYVPRPPTRVNDLAVVNAGAESITVTWSAPAAFEPASGPADSYEIGYAQEPISADNWDDALKAPEPPACAEPGIGQQISLSSLQSEEEYWICLRSRDSEGNWSDLSNVVSATTKSIDTIPPVAPVAPRVAFPATAGEDRLHISWLASIDPEVMGYHLYGRSEGETLWERLNESLIPQSPLPDWWLPRPAGNENFYLSVSAVDFAGNESEQGAETAVFTERFSLTGPFPHPIPLGESARFVLTFPPITGGEVDLDVRIYTVTGKLVRSDWLGQLSGSYPGGAEIRFDWDSRNDSGEVVAPGLYYLQITGGQFSETRKIYISK